MARRKSHRNTLPINTLIPIFGVLAVVWVAVKVLSQTSSGDVGLIIVLIALAMGSAVFLPRWLAQRNLSLKVTQAANEHVVALVRRRAQLLLRDAYGAVQTDRWNNEIDHFLTSQLTPTLSSREIVLLKQKRLDWTSLVEKIVCDAKDKNPAFGQFSSNMSPTEFEAFCAEELQRAGWDAHVTKGSRDQGVDVVAQKNGVRLVFQCKLYSQPVGNKAVQEVVAARAHESAQFGAVVSNNRYTSQAQELANTNRVALLHYSDLRNIDALIRQVVRPSV